MTVFSPLTPPVPERAGDKQRWGTLYGSGTSLAIANSSRQFPGLAMVITANSSSANELERELKFFLGKESQTPILLFPDWETLPYDVFSPHQDIISERLDTLYRLPNLNEGILITPVNTLLQRLAPPAYVMANSLSIKCGQQLNADKFRKQLEQVGYRAVDTVYEHGEFACRGSIIDIFPMGTKLPLRLDLFDNELDSLRTFDPETQRTVDRIEAIKLLPAKEFPLDPKGISLFKNQWHECFDVDYRQCPVYQDIHQGISPLGVEYYLPLFFERCSTLFEFLPEPTVLYTIGNIEQACENFWRELNQRYESRRVDPTRPILEPTRVFVPVNEFFQTLNDYPRVVINTELGSSHFQFSTAAPPSLPINAKKENPLADLEAFLLGTDQRVLFCAETAGRREILLEMLQKIDVQPRECLSWEEFLNSTAPISICVAPLDHGLVLNSENLVLIAEAQLFGERVQQRRRRKTFGESPDSVIKNLTELREGSPVVHIDHGVGRYLGLQTIKVDGQDNEFLMLEYAGQAKLYVPVANLHLISRYSASEEAHVPLHKLGSEHWQKAKRKAAEQVHDVAAELLDIYARRAARTGYHFRDPKEALDSFAQDFPFEETPDQLEAINAVFKDMISDKAMDRLVCGDVGFGKTEVAMRAAFVAAYSGKQVAILVPTTLLAQQHYDNFKDRFADWPITIDVLSRFKSGKESEATLQRVGEGKVDILIGTHKLLQSSVKYKSLGLLIIDEEHRFGVRQKDTLKSLRSEVDILTMTATPIPRTLNMAMSGMRDLSIIATPPAKRLSVKTFVRQHDKALVKEAIMRELLRGGQVYYLHNEVKTIDKTARDLTQQLPEARIAVGHGQMSERNLEQVMSDFYHKRSNILVCSTIIETGIDVPSANTIIIERADKFGLAQLHQLRGRVGRSRHQAYAYLLTPPPKTITADAAKRLEAIASADGLGAGFTLATHDLEIRGAGEILGDEQSGQIQAIGFSMYMEMLDQAVKAIKAGKSPDLDRPLNQGIDVNLRLPALIPDHYLPDVHTRLIMYKRIANAANEGQLKELQVEMIDRFGLLLEPIKNLFEITLIKLKAQALGIQKLEASSAGGRIEFSSQTEVNPLTIVKLVQNQPQKYRLEGANHLKFVEDMEQSQQRINTVNQLLDKLRNS